MACFLCLLVLRIGSVKPVKTAFFNVNMKLVPQTLSFDYYNAKEGFLREKFLLLRIEFVPVRF